ncbi:hypothetical protein [Afipia sp. DC4300-2b1]|uniref:hypothetical protein n=1 Tax=Afipia sp. DC4300-2b1 TaxID=2804672 RepID=UPI003CFA1550
MKRTRIMTSDVQTRACMDGSVADESVPLSDHIPGPWFFSQESVDPEWYIVTIKGGLVVANVNAHSRQVANARLIAAAPDLLNALEACQRVLADLTGGDKTLSTINIYAQAVEAELKARAAIAATRSAPAVAETRRTEGAESSPPAVFSDPLSATRKDAQR